jgi:hypothetical protein
MMLGEAKRKMPKKRVLDCLIYSKGPGVPGPFAFRGMFIN